MDSLNSHAFGSKPRKRFSIGFEAQILFRCPGEFRRQLEARAKSEEMQLSVWIRRALRAQLRQKVTL